MYTKKILFSLFLTLLSCAAAHADQTEKAIIDALEGQHRSIENKARDRYRHPKEVLLFFDLKPDIAVLEILPGRGWYTEILAPVLAENGALTIASFGEDNPNPYLRNIHNTLISKLADRPTLYQQVRRTVFNNNGYLKAIKPNSQDLVLTFRNTHNWIRYGGIEEVYRAFYRVLKKGGILGVVQHRAAAQSDVKQAAQQGYVPESYLIATAEKAGFTLLAKTEINANPKDTKDHPKGVWTLPPAYRLKDKDKAKYTAIGESDRMTIKFIKP